MLADAPPISEGIWHLGGPFFLELFPFRGRDRFVAHGQLGTGFLFQARAGLPGFSQVRR